MTTATKRPPIYDIYEGSGSNQLLLGTVEVVPGSAPVVFQFLPTGTVPLTDPSVLRWIATRLEALNANPPP
jgi:hypothetical protein